ncbi:MAG: hypothetical protein RMM06_11795, partial [Armatimonadota bacterium]|nr:hypothetical protein [Armatimonadota bacterium]
MSQHRWQQPIPFGWRVQPDSTVHADMPQAPLLLEGSFAQAGELKATVVVHRATTSPAFWKTVGVALWQDERHHWRLNLVEAPENLQYRHAAELHEMYNGVWLAGGQSETRLTVKEEYSQPGWT